MSEWLHRVADLRLYVGLAMFVAGSYVAFGLAGGLLTGALVTVLMSFVVWVVAEEGHDA